MSQHHGSDWTVDRVARLTKLWTVDGWSANQIARDLGGITRNAVIGKVHRLGLQFQGRAKPHVERFKKQPRAKALPKIVTKRSALTGLIQAVPSSAPPRPPPVLRSIPVTVEPVGLMALNGGCKFPVSERDGEHQFCGAPRPLGGPYCSSHARLATQPHTAQRRASDRGLERFIGRQVAP